MTVGELAHGWVKDFPLTYDEDKLKAAPWYYLDPKTGIMQTGWQYLGNKWYYLRSSGTMATGWFQVGSKWYYAYSSGALAVNTTVDDYFVNYNGEWVQ